MTNLRDRINKVNALDEQINEVTAIFRNTSSPSYRVDGHKAAALAMKLKLELSGQTTEMVSIINEQQKLLEMMAEKLSWFKDLNNYMAELKNNGKPYFDFKHTPIHNEGFEKAEQALAEYNKQMEGK